MKHRCLQTNGAMKLSVLRILNVVLDDVELLASRPGLFTADDRPCLIHWIANFYGWIRLSLTNGIIRNIPAKKRALVVQSTVCQAPTSATQVRTAALPCDPKSQKRRYA